MKRLNCKICNEYLGEMKKGKIKKDAVKLCNSCYSELCEKAVSGYKDNPLEQFKDIIGKDIFK